VDTGDSLLWNPGEYIKPFDTGTFLGFGASATFYAGAKFGLQAYANLGDGGSFTAGYDIDLQVDFDGAVPTRSFDPSSQITFTWDYSDVEVSNATIETVGFANSLDEDVPIGAGLDLIVEMSAGLRDITLINPFKDINLGDVSFVSLEERISLFSVDPLTPLFTIELTEGVELTGRLPTGANIEAASTGSTIVEGDGFSDTKFLELEADVDALLVRLLDKIPLPPVKAVARFLGDVVFAEHTFDPHDFVSQIPAGKINFNFTLLDVTASAGLVVTEDVRLDISGTDGITPYLKVELESATTGDTETGYIGLAGQSSLSLSLDAPASGIGKDDITATYSIGEAEFFHGVGIGLSASITVTVLAGNLSGAWVPSALRFSFGPLAEIEFPEDGFNFDFGNFFEDTFKLADDAFNTQSDVYSVFYSEVVPDGWDRSQQGAEQELYAFAQAFLKNKAATEAEFSQLGFDPTVASGAGTVDLTGDAGKQMFIWEAVNNNVATLDTDDGSLVTIRVDDESVSGPGRLVAVGTGVSNGLDALEETTDWARSLGEITPTVQNAGVTYFQVEGFSFNSLETNVSVNVTGGAQGDALLMIGDDATFFDGGGQGVGERDVFAANFLTGGFADVAINWDFREAVDSGQGTELDLGAGKKINVLNVESLAIVTGNEDDNISTGYDQDYIATSGGDDIVDIVADTHQDFVLLGAGDDVLTYDISQGGEDFVDFLSGGTGTDHAYISTGDGGLRYEVVPNSSEGAVFGGEGIGFDATHAQISALSTAYFSLYPSLEARSTIDDSDLSASSSRLFLLNGDVEGGGVLLFSDIEFLNVLDGGHDANDLVFFTGGTSYDGGLGTDTFAADFEVFNGLNGNPIEGGAYINGAEGGGFFGNIRIDNFERFDIYGTKDSDVLIGGAFEDYLDGGDLGDDVLYGGDDTVRDVIFAKAGNDVAKWAVDGADFIDGGAGDDMLLIEADGTENISLRLTFANETGVLPAGSDPFYFAFDSSATLLEAIGFAGDMRDNDGILQVQWESSQGVAQAIGFEHIDIHGSDTQADLLMYLGGTEYHGGEGANDIDVFAADFSDQSVGIQLDLNADIGAGSAEGVTLTNGIAISGVERAVLLAGTANDRLIGGALDDHFDGGGGADILMGHGGINTLNGGAGKDVFYYMGEGDDTIDGGDGTDYLVIGHTSGSTGLNRVIARDENGDAFFSESGVSNTTAGGTLINIASAIADGSAKTITYDYGDHSVTYSNVEVVDIAARDQANDIVFYQGGEGYVGGEADSGNDFDKFAGDFSAFDEDLYFSARGENGQQFAVGQGTVLAGFESYAVRLGGGNDEVIGGRGSDYVDGGDGDDYFDGGLGSDNFFAGAGDDTYVHTGGVDRVFFGEGEHDTLNIGGLVSAGGINAAMGFGAANEFGGFGGDVIQNADGDLSVAAFDGLLAELQTEGFHQFYKYSTPTTLYSVVAVDVDHVDITGSDENDVLVAGTRSSTLVGGLGDDFLVSYNEEVDLLSGGAGDDTYVILGGLGGVTVIGGEFDAGSRVHFDGFTRAQLSFFEAGNDLQIAGENVDADESTFVVIKDYFSNGELAGLNFEFSASDTASFFHTPSTATGTVRIVGDALKGTTENDTLEGETANSDQFEAREGDDVIMGSAGSDVIDGGLGSDGVSYLGSTERVIVDLEAKQNFGGDAEGDILIGIEQIYATDFDDAVVGDHTDNTFYGGSGEDYLAGEEGDDRVYGGFDNDEIEGGDGNDIVDGEEGDDEVYGDEGDDQLFGGLGDDMLYGGADNDVLNGGRGRNILIGEDGDDTHLFSGGFDIFDGGAGNDTTAFSNFEHGVKIDLGGSGRVTTTLTDTFDPDLEEIAIAKVTNVENAVGSDFGDVLIGTAGENIFNAGDGDDILVGGDGSDGLTGDTGIDTVDYSQETGSDAIFVDLSGTVLAPSLFLPSTFDLALDTFGALDVLSDVENIIGTDLNDTVYGDEEDNRFEGRGANDQLFGNAGNDLLIGGAGDDVIRGDGLGLITDLPDNDRIFGGIGNDFLFGGRGNDALHGGANDDELYGEDGDDFLTGGLGTDILNGGAGVDIADYRKTTQGITVDTSGPDGVVTGAEVGQDTLLNIYFALGGWGDDSFTGGADTDVFGYFGGFDSFDGGAGIDFVHFDFHTGAISVDLSAGSNVVQSNGTEDLSGRTLKDIAALTDIEGVRATDFADRFVGKDGDASFLNYFDGRGGDDVITGGLGAQNELYGGAGDDVFVGVQDFTTVAISLFDGGAGFDTVDFSADTNGISFDLDQGDGNDVLTGIEGLIGGSGSDLLFGNALDNIIEGGAGNDIINGLGGADVIRYLSGSDEIYGGSGFDTLDLSLQTAAFFLRDGVGSTDGTEQAPNIDFGDAVTSEFFFESIENFIGTNFDDTIFGGDEDNLFNDGQGDDTVNGEGGDDLFTYEGGLDTWDGGNGFDAVNFINFGSAVDIALDFGDVRTTNGPTFDDNATTQTLVNFSAIESATGTQFDDLLTGDGDINHLNGAAGDDVIRTNGGDDIVEGGDGRDTIAFDPRFESAEFGDITFDLSITGRQDTVAAGKIRVSGVENATGGFGDDTLSGNLGDNILNGSLGRNTLFGRDGNDRFIYGLGFDTIDGGQGIDTFDLSAAEHAITVLLREGPGQGSAFSSGTDSYTDGFDQSIGSVTGVENLIGSNFADRLVGDTLDNVLEGGLGADRLDGREGSDTASYASAAAAVTVNLGTGVTSGAAAEGDEYLFIENLLGSEHADTLTGDEKDNRIEGGAGDDVIDGQDGDDILGGGDGIDRITGGAGFDALSGGAGNDVLDGGADGDFIFGDDGEDEISGGDGDDDIDGGLGSDVVLGGAGNDTILETSDAESGDDTLSGNAGDDTIFGGAGDDTLFGNTGDDILAGGLGDDEINGGAGVDIASYEDAVDGVNVYLAFTGLNTSGAGTDTLISIEGLIGSNYQDRLIGDESNNNLSGGSGADILKGKGGNDTFDGGEGDDRIVGGSGDDIMFGGAGTDALFALAGADVLHGGDDRDFLYGGRDADMLFGDAGDDALRGNLGNDTIDGGAGDDDVRGGGSNDALMGGDGNDFLLGEGGKDRLMGGSGDDTLIGGRSGIFDGVQDTFVYYDNDAGGGGFDRVRDFEDGVDKIDFVDIGFADLDEALSIASERSGGVRFDFGGGDVLFIENFTLAQLTADDILL
jgi:Ca2+-binding RTX toxin-like protein